VVGGSGSARTDGEDTVVILAESRSAVERDLLARWVAREASPALGPGPFEVIVLARDDEAATLATRLARGDDPLLAPVRVAWVPKQRRGRQTGRLLDLLVVGNPHRPHRLAQAVLTRTHPDRAQVVAGEPARASKLREIWEGQGGIGREDATGFARFVRRRALLALERAASHRLGPHYKVPRLVLEEIAESTRFREGVAKLAVELDRDEAAVTQQALRYLREMATGYGSFQIDVNAQLGRLLYRQGYEPDIDYDADQVERVRAALADHPGVVLPTHRSNLDAGVMAASFHELGLPRTHTLAGINMAFWPLAPILRRSGVIFIRRNISDNEVYRWVLREYIGYLIEKRFHLEWYIEGGRSRTGKLLPPKFGLLTYVVDAYREGRAEDVELIPASMTYDQLREVNDYASEARGATKQKESAAWAVRYIRSIRGRYGKIYVRFGEPVSLRDALGPPAGRDSGDPDHNRLAMQKLAFEVCRRINHVTPITGVSLITLALLSASDQALTLPQLDAALSFCVDFAEQRALPLTDSARALHSEAGVLASLDALISQRVVRSFDDGRAAVYLVAPEQHLAAAFYRNSIIHYVLDAAVAEIALVAASEATPDEREAVFWTTALELRDDLKFDFFFLEKEQFRAAVDAELSLHDPGWRSRLSEPDGPASVLQGRPLVVAHTALRSVFEAYWVVSRVLEWPDRPDPSDRSAFFRACEGLARQYLLQRRIRNHDAITRLLFATGLQLAEHRSGGSLDIEAAATLGSHLRDVLRRLDLLDHEARIKLDLALASVHPPDVSP